MHVGIVCKVIDNYGDAGFSLRLSKALAAQGKVVTLFHDQPDTFKALYPVEKTKGLRLIDARHDIEESTVDFELDLIIEPFGTSSEQTSNRFDLKLKEKHPNSPWLLIDYLSSEKWVESYHLSQSADPATGRITTYFYPGFSDMTGGLIHCDYPPHLKASKSQLNSTELKIFVFSYPNAPVCELISACDVMNAQDIKFSVSVTGLDKPEKHLSFVHPLAFVPQSEFDELMARHDLLFVRGEDSFVRAQLAGRPFIWQIYPTEDYAHAKKLACFFDLYSVGLTTKCKSALWNCWQSWNRLHDCPEFKDSWIELQAHRHELNSHAMQWRDQLFNGRELVSEILTWYGGQTPTLIKQADL